MKKFIIISLTIIVGTFLFFFDSENASVSSKIIEEETASSIEDYLTYKEEHEQIFPNEKLTYDANATLVQAKSCDTEDDSYTDGAIIQEVSYEGISALFVPEEGVATFMLSDIPQTGYYNISLEYYTSNSYGELKHIDGSISEVKGRSASYSKGIKIANGEEEALYPFSEAQSFSFTRTWVDSFSIVEKHKDGVNDVKPSQIEKSEWKTYTIQDDEGYYDAPFKFYLTEGVNYITITSNREPMVLKNIIVSNIDELKNYQDYMESYSDAKTIDEIDADYLFTRQGEEAYSKSASILAPINDNSSSKTQPYSSTKTYLNAIGGANWQIVGDSITWEMDAPVAGFYHISIKYLQNFNRGMTSARTLYVNGEIPFKEVQYIHFSYKSDWQNLTLGDKTNGKYWFYLNEGKNYLSLEAQLGNYRDISRQMDYVIKELNSLYSDVVVITTLTPDTSQEYFLDTRIPDLNDRLSKIKTSLIDIKAQMIRYAGTRSDKMGPIDRTLLQIKKFQKDTINIPKGLSEWKTNISSLGTWILEIKEQSLTIDFLSIGGSEAKIPKASSNFFQRMWREIVMFFGSFFNDYSMTSSVEGSGETIEVWTTLGRDQAQVIRQLIDESFTPDSNYGNINVDLKLVNGGVLLPATAAGNGPDVAMNIGETTPLNYGIRGAIYDLTNFEDFEEVRARFYPSAMTPYCYADYYDGINGEKTERCYGLPEQQIFLVMFYRTDILNEMNLEVPKTWEDVNALVVELQQKYLEFYIPSGGTSAVLYSMIFQNDGLIYTEDGQQSSMMERVNINAFKTFTQYFTDYGLTIAANFSNRFRSGEMPIGIGYYTEYNTLSVFAPEISGEWEFALLPGTNRVDSEGNSYIDHTSSSATAATVIMQNSKHKQAAWQFLKWWTSEETQTNYALEMEALLGSAGRYPVANIESFAKMAWPSREYRILKAQMEQTEGVPVVPGNYIVGRYMENAFRAVYNNNENPEDALFDNYRKINAELTRKRKQFGLPVREE